MKQLCTSSMYLERQKREPSTSFKDTKDRSTILGWANTVHAHKVKLAVTGKSKYPIFLKGVLDVPVRYYTNKKAWVTREIFSDCFDTHFIPETWAHCSEAGFNGNPWILLSLDNCSANLLVEHHVKNKIFVTYFPPKVTSILQPCIQGILCFMKTKYKVKQKYKVQRLFLERHDCYNQQINSEQKDWRLLEWI